ncbi:uncharacterized protein LOC119769092 [Culex quinquefasciatus]|uniref:uncharacterized protein LOC119769092 n=1 Tax=Culex quinquefasciatus TaxID=7176 RepID=UPI0018E34E62|nr:uncharacterized protein LOC119769092 [Culex quinquefasciatus]
MTTLREYQMQERQLRSTLEMTKKFVDGFKDGEDEAQIDVRLNMLDDALAKFYVVRRKIDVLTDVFGVDAAGKEKAQDVEEHTKALWEFENLYCDLKAKLLAKRKEEAPTQAAPAQAKSTVSRVKLPEIKLPSFGGNITEWITFRDSFKSLIHNSENLSDFDKFTYLQSSLFGEALAEISTVRVSDTNYQVAWGVLENRYGNMKLILKSHLDAIFAVEPVRDECFEALNHLLSVVDKNLQMINKLGVKTEDWSILLAHVVTSKLDAATLRHWEEHNKKSKEFVKYETLLEFLREQCGVLQTIDSMKKATRNERRPPKYASSHAASAEPSGCFFCNGPQHNVFQCFAVKKMSCAERVAVARRNMLCFNCLQPGHVVEKCTRGFCSMCKRKHHTLLHENFGQRSNAAAAGPNASRPHSGNTPSTHYPQQKTQSQTRHTPTQSTQNPTQTPVSQSSQPQSSQLATGHTAACNLSSSLVPSRTEEVREVLLSTAVVRICDSRGHTLFARALLDSGSQRNLMTKEFARKLKCKPQSDYLRVKGIGVAESTSTFAVTTTVCARSSTISEFAASMRFHVLAKVTANLPFNNIDAEQLSIPGDVKLADPHFYRPGPVDMIIGAEHYYDLLSDGKMKLGEASPTIQNTELGWVVSGVVNGVAAKLPRVVANQNSAEAEALAEINDLLAKFWELESCQTPSTHSLEESACEDLFRANTVRDETGRFVVRLPKKQTILQSLGESRSIAMKRFYGLERRLTANPELMKQYSDFIHEYLEMRHMEEVKEDTEEKQAYYLPHHAVLRPDSTTTKLRVVFDASCATSSGVSLNDALMVGPVVQDDLLTIILRFHDQDLQRILWRDSPSEPVRTFKLTTVTYGTASAPYLATKCLRTVGEEVETTHPLAAKTIKHDFYVDDMLSGADSIEEAQKLVGDTSERLMAAGFLLRKWRSSDNAVLEAIPEELRDEGGAKELDSSTAAVKTLGLLWDSSSDEFKFKTPTWNSATVFTKQTVLSDTARIFDPVGLVGPVVVIAKIFLQKLWKKGIDWKEPLPENLVHIWEEFRRNMMSFDNITVPRWVGFSLQCVKLELHGFCDASLEAYGACFYTRSTWSNGGVSVNLLTSKTKVAPMTDLKRRTKEETIPRLECSSGLLMCHLLQKIRPLFPVDIEIHLWTDSMVVMSWLASAPSRWNPFVANRVSEMQHLSKGCVWHHVPGVENPADLLSRGMIPALLAYASLWWIGPTWLCLSPDKWPQTRNPTQEELEAALLEQRASYACTVQILQPEQLFTRYSSLFALIRVTALCRRFAHNARPANRECRKSGYITHAEHEAALLELVKLAQKECFPHELADLEKKGEVNETSKLNALNPRLVEGVILVGGRLRNAAVSAGRKHPMILDNHHPLTKLILQHYHHKYFHAGLQLLISSVRERFWPLSVRRAARQVIFECVPCFRNKPKVQDQLMADLPQERVNPAPPFLKTGVDYCGPFQLSYPGRKARPVRCFVAVFVCLVTKAVHLEVVTDLTTQAFLAALKRFTARRGKPQLIMCDNAKTFVGAKRELDDLAKLFCDQQFHEAVVRDAAKESIEFKFIPPRSPNFGGLWEAAVKSFKTHFKKTIGLRVLQHDEFVTVLVQIEACLNSRPLTPLSSDPNDLDVLTPGHFLVQRPLAAVAEPDLAEVPENRLSAWQRTQDFVQQIWRKWSTQYLSDLHNRTRWTRQRNNLSCGMMVLLKEENLPPQMWHLGRVTDIRTGSDGPYLSNKPSIKGPITNRIYPLDAFQGISLVVLDSARARPETGEKSLNSCPWGHTQSHDQLSNRKTCSNSAAGVTLHRSSYSLASFPDDQRS